MTERYDRAGVEPTLFEVTSDPIIQTIMRHDGVSLAEIWILISKVRAQLLHDPNLPKPSSKQDVRLRTGRSVFYV